MSEVCANQEIIMIAAFLAVLFIIFVVIFFTSMDSEDNQENYSVTPQVNTEEIFKRPKY